MGSPFMQNSPSDLSDPTDNPDAQSGPIANAHAENGHVAPRDSHSPWRHLEDPATGLPENGDIIEWFNLLAYADSLGNSPENGNQSASASSQELDNTQPNSSHAATNDDVQRDYFVNFSSPTGAGNTPPHAVDARYRYDSVQSNIAASVSPREGGNTAYGHNSARNKILASANGPTDSDARAIMIDAAQRNLLAGNFDFLDNLDDAEWRDFMATADCPELDDALVGGDCLANDNAPANGNAQANGNTAANDHNAMTNCNLSTDGNVLANGVNLLQDRDALAESNLSAEWNRLLADYNALENPYLTGNDSLLGGGNVPGNGDDTVLNGDHVMTDDNIPANLFPVNNNPLEVGTRPVNGDNTMVNGDHLMTDDNGPANLYLPETDNFLGGGTVPGNGEDTDLNGDQFMADANGSTNLTNGDHLQTADGNVSANGILENGHVPAYDHDSTDGFFNPMNTPGSTDGTNDNSRVNGSPPAVSPHRATIPHPAESPVPAGNRHPVDNPLSAGRPLSAGGPSSTETTNSDNNPQSADSPHRGDTSEAAAQGRIEQLCSEVPFPTPTYAESQKCIIRPYHIRDATALQHHANNRLITRNFSYSFPHPYTYNDARRWILNQPRITTPFTEAETPRPTVHSDGSVDVPWGNTLSFVIASCQQNERNALLSGIGVKPGFNIWNRSAELSFWIAKPYWGRGIATSAVGIFLEALFSRTLGLSRVTACTLRRKTDSGLQANFPARTVLRRNKFKREGCLRKSVFKFGEWWDQEVWAVLREDVMGDEPNMTGAVSSGPVQ